MDKQLLNLTQRQLNVLDGLYTFTNSLLKDDTSGHSMTHINRVLCLAKRILLTEPNADAFITLAAITLHDTYDDKLFKDPEKARKITENELIKEGSDPRPILYIIDNMSWSQQAFGTAHSLDLNGQIVQDSDRLDAIGAIGTVRAFKYGFEHHRTDYDPSLKPIVFKNKKEYRHDKETTINHFYEKLFKITTLLNTREGKRIGSHRDAIMHEFVDAYTKEYSEDTNF